LVCRILRLVVFEFNYDEFSRRFSFYLKLHSNLSPVLSPQAFHTGVAWQLVCSGSSAHNNLKMEANNEEIPEMRFWDPEKTLNQSMITFSRHKPETSPTDCKIFTRSYPIQLTCRWCKVFWLKTLWQVWCKDGFLPPTSTWKQRGVLGAESLPWLNTISVIKNVLLWSRTLFYATLAIKLICDNVQLS